MASVQERLKSVDEVSKKIVTGYITLSLMDVPLEIANLCLLFYFMFEAFDDEL